MSGDEVGRSYDRISGEYAERLYGELEGKVRDRELLDGFAREVRGFGKVCDMGCGPGHVAAYLKMRGVDVFGMDISAGMVEQAGRLNPGIEFRRGDMTSPDTDDGSCGGIVAFYSIIHIHRKDVPRVLEGFYRVLASGGKLLLSFHIGKETRHVEEMWGESVSLDFEFFETGEMEHWLVEAGFGILYSEEREPYGEDVEVQTRRAYILAKRSG